MGMQILYMAQQHGTFVLGETPEDILGAFTLFAPQKQRSFHWNEEAKIGVFADDVVIGHRAVWGTQGFEAMVQAGLRHLHSVYGWNKVTQSFTNGEPPVLSGTAIVALLTIKEHD